MMIRAAFVALSLTLLACGDVGAVDLSSGTVVHTHVGNQSGGANLFPSSVYVYTALYIDNGVNGVDIRNITSGNRIIQNGSCTFNGAATATCTFAIAYFDSLSYICTATKYNAVTAVGVTNTTGSVVTITSGLANDVGLVGIICVGN